MRSQLKRSPDCLQQLVRFSGSGCRSKSLCFTGATGYISEEACDALRSDASVTKPTATEMPFTYRTLEPPESFVAIRNVVNAPSQLHPANTHTQTDTLTQRAL